MAIIKKQIFSQDLDRYSVFLEDTDSKSKYFKVTQLPDIFTGGKNAFLIQGSEHLVKGSYLSIEIKDSNGDVIYYEPANGFPEYYEGVSKPISVYIYSDTAYGPCTITILGELFEYELNGKYTTIPTNWVGRPNVKWQANVNVNPTLGNSTPVRFFKRPKVDIIETALPIFNIQKTYDTFNTFVRGNSVYPNSGEQWPYSGPTQYRLISTGDPFPSALTNISLLVTNIVYDLDTSVIPETYTVGNPPNLVATITEINDAQTATIAAPYIKYPIYVLNPPTTIGRYARQFPQIWDFDRGEISVLYESSSTYVNSGISSSYVRINIRDLETFSGDVYRLKVFSKSRNDLQGYKLLEDLVIESKEFFEIEYYLNTINKRTGVFSEQDVVNTFWETISIIDAGTPTKLVDTTNKYGFGYCKLQASPLGEVDGPAGSPLFKFKHITPFDFIENTEYVLSYNLISLTEQVDNTNVLEIYASGSLTGIDNPFNNDSDTLKLGKKLKKYTSAGFRRYDRESINFTPERSGTGFITFNINSGVWSLADISLKAAKQSAFSPNEISFLTNPHIQIVSESFDFRFEFFDINYNFIPVKLEKSATFQGGNDIIPRLVVTIYESGSTPTVVTDPVFRFGQDDNGDWTTYPHYYDIQIQRFISTRPIEFISASNQIQQAGFLGGAAYWNDNTEIDPYGEGIEWDSGYPSQAFMHEFGSADGIPESTEDEKWWRIYGSEWVGNLIDAPFADRYMDHARYYIKCGPLTSTLNTSFTINTDYSGFVFPTTTTSTTTTTTTLQTGYCGPITIYAYYTSSFI